MQGGWPHETPMGSHEGSLKKQSRIPGGIQLCSAVKFNPKAYSATTSNFRSTLMSLWRLILAV